MALETYRYSENRRERTETNPRLNKFLEAFRRIPEFFQSNARRREILRAEIKTLKTPKKEELMERLLEIDTRARRKMTLISGLFALISAAVISGRDQETTPNTAQIPERLAPSIQYLTKQAPAESFDWADDLSAIERVRLTEAVTKINQTLASHARANSFFSENDESELAQLLAEHFEKEALIQNYVNNFLNELETSHVFSLQSIFRAFVTNATIELGDEITDPEKIGEGEIERRIKNELLNKAYLLDRHYANPKDHRLAGRLYEAVSNLTDDRTNDALNSYVLGDDVDAVNRLVYLRLYNEDSLPPGIEFDNENGMTMDTKGLQDAMALISKEQAQVYIQKLLNNFRKLYADAVRNNVPEENINIIKLRLAQLEDDFSLYLHPSQNP